MSSCLTVKGLKKLYPERGQSDLRSSSLFEFSFLDTLIGKKGGKRKIVLDDINIEINEGEIVGLIGPNGAGKTTLLKCIARVTSFSKGTVTEHKKVISIINLIFAFEDNDTVSTSITHTLQLLGIDKVSRQRVDEILFWSELTSSAEEQVGNLSTGMRAKLALGIIFFCDASCILFDEVLAVGDARFREKVGSEILKFTQMGGAVLLVSHDLEFIRKNSTRVLVLDSGVIVFNGQVSDGIEYYLMSIGLYELDNRFNENRYESGPVKLKSSGAISETKKIVEQFYLGQSVSLGVDLTLDESVELQVNFDLYCENILMSSFRGSPFCVKCYGDREQVSCNIPLTNFPFDNNFYKFRVSVFIRNIESKVFYSPIKVTTKSFKYIHHKEMNDLLQITGWGVAWKGAKVSFSDDQKVF